MPQSIVKSKIRYIREILKGPTSAPSQHMNLRIYSDDTTKINIAGASIHSSLTPSSGSLATLLVTNNTAQVLWSEDTTVELNIDLGSEIDVFKVGVRHSTHPITMQQVILQVSTNGTRWYTLYDSRVEGRYAESAGGLVVTTSYWEELDTNSEIVLDVQEDSFFDPKSLIWGNDKKLQTYMEKLISRSQHYQLASSSTGSAINLENPEGNYPTAYLNNQSVIWIQKADYTGTNVNIKIGTLVAKALKSLSSATLTLKKDTPYVAVYNSALNAFYVVAGEGGGSGSSVINVTVENHDWNDFDLVAFDSTVGGFIVPNINQEDPLLAEAIVKVDGPNYIVAYLSGMLDITGMKDVTGTEVVSGDVYFVDQTNSRKVTPIQPTSGWVQPVLQVYEIASKKYGLILDTDVFNADGVVNNLSVGPGLIIEDEVLRADIATTINESSPSHTKVITEASLIAFLKLKNLI